MSERSTSVEEPTTRNIVLAARDKMPDQYVRLQPQPNKASTDIYQLHSRLKLSKELRDFDWAIVVEGTLEAVKHFVDALPIAGDAGRSYVGQ